MPDHFHIIITPEERIPLEKAVQYIKGGYATAARRELGLSEVWQPVAHQRGIDLRLILDEASAKKRKRNGN